MIQLDNRRFIKAYKPFKGMYKIVLYYRVPYRNIFGKLCKKNVAVACDYSHLRSKDDIPLIIRNLEFKVGVNRRSRQYDRKAKLIQKKSYKKLK